MAPDYHPSTHVPYIHETSDSYPSPTKIKLRQLKQWSKNHSLQEKNSINHQNEINEGHATQTDAPLVN